VTALYWLACLIFAGLWVKSDTDIKALPVLGLFCVALALWMGPLFPAPLPFYLPSIPFWL
jgi:hypothetical protein